MEQGQNQQQAGGMADGSDDGDRTFVIIIYVLYAVGFFTALTALAGVIMAHLKQGQTSEWLQSHLRYQIRTFYIGLAAVLIGAVLSVVLIGWLVLLAWVVWAVMRIVVGLMQLTANKPIPNPEAWGTGL